MDKFQVNKKLLPVKANYFLINAGHSATIPFIAVYAKQMGIGADVMGLIYAIVSCITVVSKPLIGGLVDHFQKLKCVLVALILVDISADMGLNFIPQTPSNFTNTSLACLGESSYVLTYDDRCSPSDCFGCVTSCALCHRNDSGMCANSTGYPFVVPPNCTDAVLDKCDPDPDPSCSEKCSKNSADCADDVEINPPLQLWLLAVFAALIYICNGSIVSLSDAACFNALGDDTHLYGKQRMWGTMGWGTFALLAGYLNQLFTGDSKTYSYSPGFYLMAVLLLVDLAILPKLQLKEARKSQNIFKDIGLFVIKPRILVFIFQVFFVGIFVGMSRSYLFWYLRTLDASQLMMGFTSVVQCFFGELPFFFFSGWIISKIGHLNTFTMSFAAHGVKFLSYSYLVNPWWGLPIEIMQGPCFGSFYSAMTSYAKIVAPPGAEATVQGIASATFEGLGLATGSILGGYGFRVFGGRTTFFWTAIFSFGFAMLNCVVNVILVCKNPAEH